jgi:glucose-1-phosphatase
MIKALLFDLGNVIAPLDFSRGYAALQERCPYPAQEIRLRIRATDLVPRFEMGLIQVDEFIKEFSDLLDLHVEQDEFRRLWNSIFLPDSSIPEEMLAGLRRRYRLLLLSNTNVLHFEMLRESVPQLRYFDEFILSYEVGALKPSQRIYQEAIRRSGSNAEECFFTDDIEAYVEAARREGMQGAQFLSCRQIEEELRSRGVEW